MCQSQFGGLWKEIWKSMLIMSLEFPQPNDLNKIIAVDL